MVFRSGHPHSATIEVIEGDHIGEAGRFQGGVPIGRAPSNVFSFPDDESLAEFHNGIVFRDDDRWYCINADPSAAIFVDDVRCCERYTLIPSGSVVRCGRQAFRVTYLEPGGKFDGSPVEAVRVGQQEDAARLVRQAIAGFLAASRGG